GPRAPQAAPPYRPDLRTDRASAARPRPPPPAPTPPTVTPRPGRGRDPHRPRVRRLAHHLAGRPRTGRRLLGSRRPRQPSPPGRSALDARTGGPAPARCSPPVPGRSQTDPHRVRPRT